ncbi:unnamed protein product [Nyctereutes procyonoides]|uniref:40S ribosomal protein S26 n=1 Tax=Nyctereutes procyonoides TaxID=34880 RepID=A0A811Z0X1_NYCPR|nr:unnamed protein product [Nyctereutes procyonoides]
MPILQIKKLILALGASFPRWPRKGNSHMQPSCCANCTQCVPLDEDIRKPVIGDTAEATAIRDISKVSVLSNYVLPKLSMRPQYCVGWAVCSKAVRTHSCAAQVDQIPSTLGHVGAAPRPWDGHRTCLRSLWGEACTCHFSWCTEHEGSAWPWTCCGGWDSLPLCCEPRSLTYKRRKMLLTSRGLKGI